MKIPQPISRRRFVGTAAVGAGALGLAGCATSGTEATIASSASSTGKPVLMKPGHQHDHSETTLRALAAFGVTNICSGLLSRDVEKDWSIDALTGLRRHVESFGIKLDCVPLPLSSRDIAQVEMPEILLAKDPARD